jgi:SAM-dependent methyltransferase
MARPSIQGPVRRSNRTCGLYKLAIARIGAIQSMSWDSRAAMIDYRTSHLERGETYDATLSASPFDAYMADWETHHLVGIVRELFPDGVSRYLDFACGTGRITATVAPFSRSSVAIDVSPSMIEVARSKVPGVSFHLCDLTKDDIDLGTFELVTSFRFFGNAQDELRESALAAIVKRMSPGAYLIADSHRNPHALNEILHRITGGGGHGTDLHLGKLRHLMEHHALKIRRLQPIGAWMYRSKLLGGFRADDPAAVANERRFGRRLFAAIAPDLIVVAQHA